ncbi:MAG: methylenetetrahydrofolate--tRNA-(uracil(54)-C(5))-methyltransferase (FADH(2)-oxidizing) TrmFO [Rhizobiales bacterium]|nr:methylenetetrahydrofolate--tRNA-(uracil(54)-C(5))-methyltransferase (FADH(2)-oxidizing) TrmFO [Hyphomicrobiales bacterium]
MKNNNEKTPVHVIGGGLAGSEACWQLAQAGVPVVLHEMRPVRPTEVHQTEGLAELVCSNSFRSDDALNNAVGLLHEEMRRCGSLIMKAGDEHRVPAGSALAVDREAFSMRVTKALEDHPNIEIVREEITEFPPEDWGLTIIATGPLTSPALGKAIQDVTGETELAFFDAIAPIIHRDTINMDVAWFQSRYDKQSLDGLEGPGGVGADYINCPMDKAQYETFIAALIDGEKADFQEWEKDTPYFDGCLPIEVMAERGVETLRFGPMKPVGLTNPHDPDVKSYAVIQLRQDNALATLYNMVGFQTKLKYGDQKRIFNTIPGLEDAEFARLGGLHRNTFLNSPSLLDEQLRLRAEPRIRFAGQITGCEGYIESATIGLCTGRMAAAEWLGGSLPALPPTTAMGALLGHIAGGHIGYEGKDYATRSFQPMNINFGLFPDIEFEAIIDGRRARGRKKRGLKRTAICHRALADMDSWLAASKF